ncbi:MAG: MFS transporter [Gemmatimonadetes bacterium]|nr:MFS transporter [Gemmatimonadota bacterium]
MTADSPPGREVWRTNLAVLVGAQLLAVSAMGILIPLIPFFVRELGTTDRAAVERWSGLIFSGPFLMAALLSPVWGWAGDRFGHKRMVVRAVIGLAVVNFLLVFVETPLQFWIIRLVQGAVTGFIPAALAITSSSTPPAHLPDAMGRLSASASAGRLLGPAIGGMLAAFLAFRQLFLVTGVIISIAAVVVMVFLKEPPRAPGRPPSAAKNMRWILAEPRMRLALPGLLLSMAGVSMVMPIFPLYVEDLLGAGIDPKFVTGLGFAVVAGATLIGASLLGRVTARIGLKVVLVGSLVLTAVALALHPLASGVPSMIALRVLLGFAVAGVAPVLHTMISRAAPDGMRGGVTGYASSATILGFFVGPLVGGWLANHVGVSGVFVVAAGVSAACGAGAAVVARRLGRDRDLVPAAVDIPR